MDCWKQSRRFPQPHTAIDDQSVDKACFQQGLDRPQLSSDAERRIISLFEKVIQLDGERSLINISPCHFALSVEELA